MQIDPKDLLPIKDFLKQAGIPFQEGQVEKVVEVVNRLLQHNDEIEKQTEAELGPEKWAKFKAEREDAITQIGKNFSENLQKILDSSGSTDKL
jgi:hypothetical protein